MSERKRIVRLSVPSQEGKAAAVIIPTPVTPAPATLEPAAPAPAVSAATAAAKDIPVAAEAQTPAITPAATKGGITAERIKDAACPKCGYALTSGDATPLFDTTCVGCGHTFMVPGHLAGFIITGRLGVGEMGQIYRARDETLYREVAIKVVRAARQEETKLHDRLREEARAAARLSHPHVAEVFALGFSNGHPYLVMELVRGEDMDVKLQKEGAFSEREALRIAEEITEGLQALHQEGLTHGDIKPANIIMNRSGSTKLVDFGLAGMSRHEGKAVLGTPQYIAPESLRGEPDSSQTDLYSLGATLYHLLAGKPPFDGPTPIEVARARLHRPADPIERHVPTLSEPTRRIIMRMLEAEPAKRYPECGEALKDIREARKRLDLPPAAAPQQPTATDQPSKTSLPAEPAPVQPRPANAPSNTPPPPRQQPVSPPPPAPAAAPAAAPRQAPPPAPVAAPPVAPKSPLPPTPPTPVAPRVPAAFAVRQTAPAPVAKPEPPAARGTEGKRINWLILSLVVAIVILALALVVAYQWQPGNDPSTGEQDQPTNETTIVENVSPSNVTPETVGGSDQPPAVPTPTPQVPAEMQAGEIQKAFPVLLSPRWSLSRTESGSRGSTVWLKGTLILKGAGPGQTNVADRGRSFYASVTSNFAFSAKLTTAATKNEGMTGLHVWEASVDAAPNLIFGRLSDGKLALRMREGAGVESSLKTSESPVSFPLYLQIIRRGNRFDAFSSADGIRWTAFGQCTLNLSQQVYIGIVLAAGLDGSPASAEYEDIALRAAEGAAAQDN